MKKHIYFAIILVIFTASNAFSQTKTYEFKNGQWFDGKTFKRHTMYSINGVFAKKKPNKIDESVDLQNSFVIPPFADAHTHNLDGTRDLDRLSNAYLAEGTFYVQVLANYGEGAKQARPFLNKPTSLDVIYANGMLTCTYGHPFMVYEPYAMNIYSPIEARRRIEEVKKSRIAENGAYWFFDSRADVDAKWGKFLASKPDIVKIGLLDAENQQKYVAEGNTVDKGLLPEVAEYVVQKAHQANLKVYAHIETANDFRLGLKIGVDGFAHSPNYGWKGIESIKDDVTLADIKLAAKKGVVVIPTANIADGAAKDYDKTGKESFDAKRFQRIIERQKTLFNLLFKNGVNIALGSDYFGKTLGVELRHLHDNKIFDNKTLLKIAVEKTPQAIFPNRKIGKFSEGYEASFITVAENPLVNFETLKNINLRFKQGIFIELNK